MDTKRKHAVTELLKQECLVEGQGLIAKVKIGFQEAVTRLSNRPIGLVVQVQLTVLEKQRAVLGMKVGS